MKVDQLDACDHPDAVDVLVAEYLDALDHGQAPLRSEWLDRHPEHTAELARFLDDLERLTPQASTVKADETQMLPGGKAAKEPARDSETVLWNASAAATDHAAAGLLPFNGSFGAYELLETVARGGMGVVFKARQRQLDRIVALKMILAGQLADEQHIQRFKAEAQAAAQLDHPGIVPVHEVGEEQGLHYFTMAFIEGKSLAERLRDGPLPPKEAARLVRDLAAAIAYAHEHGIVHRDLKPANVLIDAQGQPKLTDFGLAKQTQHASEMTGTGQILGTPSYMSPEQAHGGTATVGPASDVYGLGALLFALLTGRPPFQGASQVDTIQHVISAEPPKPRSLNPGVPRDLETICLKCLEKSAQKRYGSALVLKADLDRFLDDRPILARPVGLIEKAYRWYRRRPVIGTMAATLTALMIAVPVLLAFLLVEADARADLEAVGRDNEMKAREKVEKAHEKTKAAERERTRQLFQAYVNEVAARRTSPRVGRGFDALERIGAARELADELKLPVEDFTRLRSEAISALSLMDLRPTKTGPGWFLSYHPHLFRHAQANDCYLSWDKPSKLLVRRIGDQRVVQQLKVEYADWHIHQVRISPDNRFVSSQMNDNLIVWQIDGEEPKEVARHKGVSVALFSPDRAEIIIVTSARNLLIQPLDGKSAATTVRIAEITKAARPPIHGFMPGPRRHAAIEGINRVFVVDLDAGKVVGSFPVTGYVEGLAWSADGETLAASGMDVGVTLYSMASKNHRLVKTTVGGPERTCFEPAGRYLLAFNEWTTHSAVVDVKQAAQVLRFHPSELSPVNPHRTPVWWQGSMDGAHRVLMFAGEHGSAGNQAVHPAGRLMATASPKGAVLSDLATGSRLMPLAPGSWTAHPCFDEAGNLFILQRDAAGLAHAVRREVKVEGNRYLIGPPEWHNLPGPTLAISRDGNVVAVGAFRQGPTVLDRPTGKRTELPWRQDVRGIAVSPDGSMVAAFGFSADGFRVWDAKTAELLFTHSKGNIGSGGFTPDGKHLVSYAHEEPGLNLWSVPDGRFVRNLGTLGAFDISPDSKTIAVTEHNGKLRLTRLADGALIARFDAPGEDYVNAPTFSGDGRYLIAMSVDRDKQHFWDLWKLRRRLAEMKLDWETEGAPEPVVIREPIVVEIAPQTKR